MLSHCNCYVLQCCRINYVVNGNCNTQSCHHCHVADGRLTVHTNQDHMEGSVQLWEAGGRPHGAGAGWGSRRPRDVSWVSSDAFGTGRQPLGSAPPRLRYREPESHRHGAIHANDRSRSGDNMQQTWDTPGGAMGCHRPVTACEPEWASLPSGASLPPGLALGQHKVETLRHQPPLAQMGTGPERKVMAKVIQKPPQSTQGRRAGGLVSPPGSGD